ncbi:hypothetical protein [Glutamicibacter sp. NPDC087344]|uniref:hypothetical protein n=1 Tax=Glutamicibacter sp. NPDC087344 TaxID=3363994 RepID=UPI0038098DD8
MGKTLLKRALGSLAALGLVGALGFAAVPAQASERPIDITGYTVSSITVADSSCRNVSVKASTKVKSDFVDSYGIIDVTRNGGLVDSLWMDGRKISDRAFICPSYDGLGVYKVGPADISAEYDYWDSYFGDYFSDYSYYTDNTSKTFNVRGKTKSTLKATRSGSKVTLTATAQVYAPEKYRYAQYNAKKAKFQVKSGKTWKTLKTVDLKKGTAKITVKQSKKKSYRLTIPTATWAASTTTKTVAK